MGYTYTAFTARIPNIKVTIIEGELVLDDGSTPLEEDVPKSLPLIESTCNDGWGCVKGHSFISELQMPMPQRLRLRYICEGCYYVLDTPLDVAKAEELWKEQAKGEAFDAFQDIVVGTAPFGLVTVWLQGRTRSVLLQEFHAETGTLEGMEKIIYGEYLRQPLYEFISRKELENDTRQYQLKYTPLEEWWDDEKKAWVAYSKKDLYYDDMDIKSVEDRCTDGTFNYMEDDPKQMKYHASGQPYRITVRWHEGTYDCMAHFWFFRMQIAMMYDQFFFGKPEKKAEMMVRLDIRHQHYQIALRTKGTEEDFVIPFYAYQLIVFRDGMEHYKSPNFQLEPGQWSWF